MPALAEIHVFTVGLAQFGSALSRASVWNSKQLQVVS